MLYREYVEYSYLFNDELTYTWYVVTVVVLAWYVLSLCVSSCVTCFVTLAGAYGGLGSLVSCSSIN